MKSSIPREFKAIAKWHLDCYKVNKSCLSLRKLLLLLLVVSIPSALFKIEPCSALTAEEIEGIARKTTVLIDAGDVRYGSGTIIAKSSKANSTTYYVLTAAHVVKNNTDYSIVTPDGNAYSISANDYDTAIYKIEGADLAIVKFGSKNSYQTATLADYESAETERYIFVSGCMKTMKNKDISECSFRLSPGVSASKRLSEVYRFNPNSQAGYRLAYTNFTEVGISGGAVLDTDGRVIGVHGVVDGLRTLEDGKQIPFGYALGIPISTLLTLVQTPWLSSLNLQVDKAPPKALASQEITSIGDALIEFLNLKSVPETLPRRAGVYDWIAYGNQALRLADFLTAKQSFCIAISKDEHNFEAWFGKAFSLMNAEEYSLALSAFRRAILEYELRQNKRDNTENVGLKSAYYQLARQFRQNLERIVNEKMSPTSNDSDCQKTIAAATSSLERRSTAFSEGKIEALRQAVSLQIPPVVAAQIVRPAVSSPGISITSPTAFGFDGGTAFVAGGLINRGRYNQSADGAMAFGLGLGNARRAIGFEVAATSFNLRDGLGNGSLSFKLHRLFPNELAIAIGLENAIVWSSSRAQNRCLDDFEVLRSIYLIASKSVRFKRTSLEPLSTLTLSVGVGNGRFRPERNLLDESSGTTVVNSDGSLTCSGVERSNGRFNVFGSVSLQVVEPVSVIADWSGQDLSLGISAIPFRNIPLSITTALTDVTGNAGDGRRFIFGIGYILRF